MRRPRMKYEVVKLRTGSEICGMIKDMDEWIEITLPMICQLTKMGAMETLATFIPYAPLSKDSIITIARDDVMHRSNLNEQFIPFYDEASSRWLTMVESETIPLTNKMPTKEMVSRTVGAMLENMTDEELDAFEDEELMDDLTPPMDKALLH
jgi:hypothetical protein